MIKAAQKFTFGSEEEIKKPTKIHFGLVLLLFIFCKEIFVKQLE
jgi:hypothetical protein